MPKSAMEVSKADFGRKCALVVGSEGQGVSERLSEKATRIRIPTVGVESLNAALAAGIALFVARSQRMAAG
jgi:TrmH family RNA methyltransferase